MLIENPDALKGWLTAHLEPLCEADPRALSKYVMALIKKDKPEKELKDNCLDQLEVFLQKETKSFVELLFGTLSDKSYLKHQQLVGAPVFQPVTVQPVTTVTTSTSTTIVQTTVATSTSTIVVQTTLNGTTTNTKPVVTIPTPQNTKPVASIPTPQNTKPVASIPTPQNTKPVASIPTPQNTKPVASIPTPQPTPVVTPIITPKPDSRKSKSDGASDNENRETRRSGAKAQSRSRSPGGRGNKREPDDRRGRRYVNDERRRRPYPSHRYDNRYKDLKNHRVSSSIDRDREREKERDRDSRFTRDKEFGNKDRSAGEKSKSRSRSRSWSHSRSRTRSWSPPSLGSRSRSRSRSFSRDRSRAYIKKSSCGQGETPQRPSDHGDTDYRVPPHSTGPSLVINIAEPVSSTVPGIPPVAASPYTNRGTKRCRDFDEKGFCMQGDMCPFDHGTDPVVVEDVSLLGFRPTSSRARHVNVQAPPPPGIRPTLLPLHGPLPLTCPPFPPGVSTHLPPPPESYTPEPYNPEAPGIKRPFRIHQPFWGPKDTGMPPVRLSLPHGPPPMFHPPPQRTRELIGVPTIDSPIVSTTSFRSQPVFEPEISPSIVVTASHNSIGTGLVSSVSVQPSIVTNVKQRPFGYNNLGSKKHFSPNQGRCTLEVRKVPRHLNTITHLNKHFSKFGNIVNLQVCYSGDPEAALVQYSSHMEANSAYRNTEAVLNNRFIKVFWHNKESNQGDQDKKQLPSEKSNVKDKLGNFGNTKINNVTVNNKPSANVTAEDAAKRCVVFSSSGNLSRTMFNPAVLKKNNTLVAASQNSGLKKTKEEQKKESFIKKLEVQKKREELLNSYFQQQKILLEKWEKTKSEKEKEEVKQTLESLNKMIQSLQNDMRKDSEEIQELQKTSTTKSKSEAKKQLLDAEMDLYNKQHKGDDITELKKKVTELRQKAKAMGLLDKIPHGHRGHGAIARGRGFHGRNSRNSTSLDHRPKKILVSGTEKVKKMEMHVHFVQFGEIESVEDTSSGIVVAFKRRRDAEKAVALGSKYNGQILTLVWYRDPTVKTDTQLQVEHVPEEETLDGEEDILLRDEEEDEDSEARSWRR
ncbi:RNA-binding protein 26-like isoform X2 [Tachypleus tridentatus]|uniref:RNA-binding protein 26-like isoform X2 n=1 Tax=Tachypleus tridentatus TaxID=6853 RepID=UPI003FD61E4A